MGRLATSFLSPFFYFFRSFFAPLLVFFLLTIPGLRTKKYFHCDKNPIT